VEYSSCFYRLNARDRYLIWVSCEKDSNSKDTGVVDAAGFIPTFENPLLLRGYADLHRYNLQSEAPILHDLDWVAVWTNRPAVPVNLRGSFGRMKSVWRRSVHILHPKLASK
jgi:hypothetical protein